jgi:hypothetical protein
MWWVVVKSVKIFFTAEDAESAEEVRRKHKK